MIAGLMLLPIKARWRDGDSKKDDKEQKEEKKRKCRAKEGTTRVRWSSRATDYPKMAKTCAAMFVACLVSHSAASEI